MKIVTTSQIQKNIALLSESKKPLLIMSRGKPRSIQIPYFEGMEDYIEDFLEDMEIALNKDKLEKKWKASMKSGLSDFVI